MYEQSFHQISDIEKMQKLVHDNPFATLICPNNAQTTVDHIPFYLDSTVGECGCLYAHIAAKNPLLENLANSPSCIIVFQASNSYISPSWYPSKHEHGKAVPTWNYAVVHARGDAIMHRDPEWILRHLNLLTERHESQQSLPWKISDAPNDYIDTLLSLIVGIEIPIMNIQGKWKLNQNKSEADRIGVVAGLLSKSETDAQRIASLVRETLSTAT